MEEATVLHCIVCGGYNVKNRLYCAIIHKL